MTSKVRADRFLVVIDFDHTITSENTDTWVLESLLPGETVKELRSQRQSEELAWQQFMNKGFQALHAHKISQDQILQVMQNTPILTGFDRFLKVLGNSEDFRVAIASDSNSIFIDTILKNHNLEIHVDEVFTNPAHFDGEGRLCLFPHHSHSCPTCEPNICKQEILKTHLQREEDRGHKYERIFVIGDGGNDFCPCKLLRGTDCVFPRRGYRLMRTIDALGSEAAKVLEAEVIPWETGEDLLTSFRVATGQTLE